jgi:hypothetical protein
VSFPDRSHETSEIGRHVADEKVGKGKSWGQEKGFSKGLSGIYDSQSLRKKLPPLFHPIFQNHLINDLSAEDASPPEEFFRIGVEFLIVHLAATTSAFHDRPP